MSHEYIIHFSRRGGSIAQQQRVNKAHYENNRCKDTLTCNVVKLLKGRRVVLCYFGEEAGGDAVCDAVARFFGVRILVFM
jgi:hypothetical protein